MKHVESKLFNQNGHFYFSFQICITCTYIYGINGSACDYLQSQVNFFSVFYLNIEYISVYLGLIP